MHPAHALTHLWFIVPALLYQQLQIDITIRKWGSLWSIEDE